MSNKTQRCNRHMEFNVSDIFRVIPGKRITREFAARHSGDIGVVKSGCDNKGVMCYMSKDSGYTESYMEDCGISLAGKFVYYHDRPIFLNDGAVGLKMLAKEYESKYTYIFLTVIMRKWAMESRFQQSYATTEKKVVESQLKLRLPVDDNGNPDYKFMEQYIKERWVDYSWAKQPVNKNSTIKLSDAVWNEYRIGDLFKVTYGKFIKDNKCGTVKYITATAKNNGFGGMVNGEPMYSGNCITIASDGSIGSTFYQGEPFSASNIVVTLEPIGETMLNDYIAMFICTLIREESSKYSYGRKYSVERVRNTILRLPSTPEGTPDYEFMEEYIKSLPYSIVLDKVPDNN